MDRFARKIDLHPNYVTAGDGSRVAVQLKTAEYDALLAELEDIEDLRAYLAAKTSTELAEPYDQVRRELGLAE